MKIIVDYLDMSIDRWKLPVFLRDFPGWIDFVSPRWKLGMDILDRVPWSCTWKRWMDGPKTYRKMKGFLKPYKYSYKL